MYTKIALCSFLTFYIWNVYHVTVVKASHALFYFRLACIIPIGHGNMPPAWSGLHSLQTRVGIIYAYF